MSQNFQPGDFLIFQIESGYGLLRLLAIDERPDGTTWHLAAYSDLFLGVEMADAALDSGDRFKNKPSTPCIDKSCVRKHTGCPDAERTADRRRTYDLDKWRQRLKPRDL